MCRFKVAGVVGCLGRAEAPNFQEAQLARVVSMTAQAVGVSGWLRNQPAWLTEPASVTVSVRTSDQVVARVPEKNHYLLVLERLARPEWSRAALKNEQQL